MFEILSKKKKRNTFFYREFLYIFWSFQLSHATTVEFIIRSSGNDRFETKYARWNANTHIVVSFMSAQFTLRVLTAHYIVNTPEKSMEHRFSSTYLFNTLCQMHNHTTRVIPSPSLSRAPCVCTLFSAYLYLFCIMTNYISMLAKSGYKMVTWSIYISVHAMLNACETFG